MMPSVYKGRVIELTSYQSEGTWIPRALVSRGPADEERADLAFADAALPTREAADDYALAAAKRWIDERGIA